MKKTTLYKLVKQALYEVFKEKKEDIPKELNINLEKITLLERAQLNDSFGKKAAKKRDKKRSQLIEQVNNFLYLSSLSGIPIKEIANDPLLKDINIDGLEAIYKKIPTLTLTELKELLPLLLEQQMQCSCYNGGSAGNNGCPNYGTMQVYSLGCETQALPIDDRFICCSSNNKWEDSTEFDLVLTQTGFSGNFTISAGGVGGCIDPTSLVLGAPAGPDNVGQISYDDLHAFATQHNSYLIGSNQWNPSFYSG